MRSTLRLFTLVLVGALLATPAMVAVAGEAKPPSERELRQAMTRAEKRFLELYNQLNTDARHRMECEAENRAGSRMRSNRSCSTRGVAGINEDAAREYLRGMELSSAVDTDTVAGRGQAASSRDFGGPADQRPTTGAPDARYGDDAYSSTEARLREERAAFDAHLEGLMAKHPQLRERFDEYVQARARLEGARAR